MLRGKWASLLRLAYLFSSGSHDAIYLLAFHYAVHYISRRISSLTNESIAAVTDMVSWARHIALDWWSLKLNFSAECFSLSFFFPSCLSCHAFPSSLSVLPCMQRHLKWRCFGSSYWSGYLLEYNSNLAGCS